jgi:soluble lytic murein transglycosylase-like protein
MHFVLILPIASTLALIAGRHESYGSNLNLFAPSDETIAQQSQLCLRYFSAFERAHHIPPMLLRAISIAESGIYHKSSNQQVPWPWAMNVQGKGYYFSTKAQAIAAVRKFQRQGIQSIDVGCMQINLYFHPEAFASLEQAFEPRNNIGYAAQFLRGHYDRNLSWKKAVASYHSERNELGVPYAKKVLLTWQKERQNNQSLPFTIATNETIEANRYNSIIYNAPDKKPNKAAEKIEQRRKSQIFIRVSHEEIYDGAPPPRLKIEQITKEALR